MKGEDLILFGLLFFSFFIGGWGWWLERKLTARFQYRVGPPWYQNFIDILKLFSKEQIIPSPANRVIFILSPIATLSSVILVTIILDRIIFLREGFLGDLFVILYLLIIPSLFIILGAFSSSNPLATVGGTREIKLMLAYEFVFILSLLIVIIKSGGVFSLEKILDKQMSTSYINSFSGIIGFLLALFYLQAKLGIVPFDVSEAEQEIMSGVFIEYGGPLLGFYRLARAFLYFSLPMLVIAFFMGKNLGWQIAYKYLIIILIISVIKNINPRLRVKDVLSLFWFFLFPLGIVGMFLSILGY
ncbi:MAG: NADH-quinone oxidoreductase subunit H [Candidatus Omnitrophica bacterium]|nr:NADH-quinone oxidoreductase subunit H [Candidatus Omnitrophota bacterium]